MIERLTELRAELERAWCRETSTDPVGWTPQRPSKGQCGVTALLVHDELGGSIVRALVGGCSHYWNLLVDGTEVDLTRDQFAIWILSSPIEPRSRAALAATLRDDGRSTAERYAVLRQRLGR